MGPADIDLMVDPKISVFALIDRRSTVPLRWRQARVLFIRPTKARTSGPGEGRSASQRTNVIDWQTVNPEDRKRAPVKAPPPQPLVVIAMKPITKEDGRRLERDSSVAPIREVADEGAYLMMADEALRESQQPFQSLVHSIDGIVWELDYPTWRFTFVSKQAERILGYPIAQWLNDPDFWPHHLHPDDRSWAIDFCMKATQKGETHQFEYRMIAADGRCVWLRDLVTVEMMNGQPVPQRRDGRCY